MSAPGQWKTLQVLQVSRKEAIWNSKYVGFQHTELQSCSHVSLLNENEDDQQTFEDISIIAA